MGYGLRNLKYRRTSIFYVSTEGRRLRESPSVEENALFLVRWASELFCDWATWMQAILPGS